MLGVYLSNLVSGLTASLSASVFTVKNWSAFTLYSRMGDYLAVSLKFLKALPGQREVALSIPALDQNVCGTADLAFQYGAVLRVVTEKWNTVYRYDDVASLNARLVGRRAINNTCYRPVVKVHSKGANGIAACNCFLCLA